MDSFRIHSHNYVDFLIIFLPPFCQPICWNSRSIRYAIMDSIDRLEIVTMANMIRLVAFESRIH
jgi:hypothetical protein